MEIGNIQKLEDLKEGQVVIGQFGKVIGGTDEEFLVCSGVINGNYEFLEKGKRYYLDKDIEIHGWQIALDKIEFSSKGEIIINPIFRELETYNPKHPDYKAKRELVSKLEE